MLPMQDGNKVMCFACCPIPGALLLELRILSLREGLRGVGLELWEHWGAPPAVIRTDRHGSMWRRKERAWPSENQSSFGESDEKWLERQVKGVKSARQGVLGHSTPCPIPYSCLLPGRRGR